MSNRARKLSLHANGPAIANIFVFWTHCMAKCSLNHSIDNFVSHLCNYHFFGPLWLWNNFRDTLSRFIDLLNKLFDAYPQSSMSSFERRKLDLIQSYVVLSIYYTCAEFLTEVIACSHYEICWPWTTNFPTKSIEEIKCRFYQLLYVSSLSSHRCLYFTNSSRSKSSIKPQDLIILIQYQQRFSHYQSPLRVQQSHPESSPIPSQ